MGEVYDLHQYTQLLVIYIQKTKVCFDFYSSTEKNFVKVDISKEKDTCIAYDKQKMNIKSWGESDYDNDTHIIDKLYQLFQKCKKKWSRDDVCIDHFTDEVYQFFKNDKDEWDDVYINNFTEELYQFFKEDKYERDDVFIDNFRDELYQLFKKDKDEWNEDDLFLLKAVSDFIRLSIENKIEKSKERIKGTNQLHYIFVVPSEWEEEIRETLLRPILIQSNLISKDDHNDRLLFCSDLESIFYHLIEWKQFDFEKRSKTISCILIPISKEEVLIKLDLVSTVNRLFDFPDSSLYPNVNRSNSLSLTINTFIDGIRAFIKDELPLSIQEEIIQIIIDKEHKEYKEYEEDEEDEEEEEEEEEVDEKEEEGYLKKPLITDTSRWELNECQLDFIGSICILDICSQVRKNMTNNIDDLLSNDTIKEYNFFSRFDSFSSEISLNENLLKWSRYMLTYNRIYSRNENIKCTSKSFGEKIDSYDIMRGACRFGRDFINNANIYSRPRILPVENSANSSSVFLESKPDAIMNIDILIESTILSFSLLDENGFVKEVWNHDNFLKDKSLRSLGSFFSFSETTTLKVKSSFIEFSKDHLMDDTSFLSGDKDNRFFQLNAAKIEIMLCKNSNTEDLLVSTQQQIYIEIFLLLYMAYIKYVISSRLPDIVGIKIGYNITVEKILQNRLFDTKEGLKDIIYASGLIQKDDSSKKLRIITQGERIMYLLQRSLALPFPLNSYFVLAQLHENYIQLTLKKVVTDFSSSEDDQEAVIIHDRIINIPNIYTTLCLNMWSNIVEDSSLIKLCERHQEYNDIDLSEIFSLNNQAKFTENLKQYISKDNPSTNSSQPATDEINIPLSASCNCRAYLTVRDIIDISFQPVLQDIASLVSASFINKKLFGKFWNIQYFFQLIHFDYNSQLHDSLIKMLKETTDDITIDQGVDIPNYVISKSLNQLLQPVLHQQPVSYKEFQVGTLHQVHGDTLGFGFFQSYNNVPLVYKSATIRIRADPINNITTFPLFKKGDIINDLSTNLTLYLNSPEENYKVTLCIRYFKLKIPCDLNPNGTVRFNDVDEIITASSFTGLAKVLKMGQDVPIMISIFYKAYLGSLTLRAKLVGQNIGINEPITLGIPMHLSRF